MRNRAFAVVVIVSMLTALLPFGVARADTRDDEGRLDVSVLERGTQTPASDYSGLLSRIVSGTYTDESGTPLNESSIANISASIFGKTGLTADGNTRLMLRAQTDKPGIITFSIPSDLGAVLENLSRSAKSNSSVSIMTEQVSEELHQATAILTAPADYPLLSPEPGMSFPSENFSVAVSLNAEDGTVQTQTLSLTVNAAPVVFIHGIFGDSESAFGKGDSKGIWHILDQAGMMMYFWNYDNVTGPTDVIPAGKASLLYGKIASVCMDYASRGIACTRVDLVGHSMGGLMARRFTLADEGHRSGLMSYGQGAVRRIITIAAPHRGSPIADLVIESERVQRFFETIGSRVIAQHDYVRDASSAWSDLYEPNAVAMGFPDDVPMYSICGNVREAVSSLTDDVVSYVREGQTLAISKMLESGFANISVMLKVVMNLQALAGVANGAEKMINDSLFSGQEHDICVSVPSARDDFTEAYSTKYDGMDYRHDTICKQDDTGRKVLELLRGPESVFKVFASDNELETSPANLQASGRYDELIADLESLNIQYDGITLSIDKEVLNISRGTTEQLTLSITDGAEDSTSCVMLSGRSGVRFLMLEQGASSISLSFSDEECGTWSIVCFSSSGGNISMSDVKLVTILADVDSSDIAGLEFSDGAGRIFLTVSSDVPAGLYATTKDGKTYSVSSPLAGTSWTFSDAGVVSVTDTGLIHGLRNGETTITAEYLGQTASVNVIVSPDVMLAENNSDNTPDTPGEVPDNNSGGEALEDIDEDTPGSTYTPGDDSTRNDYFGESSGGGGCSLCVNWVILVTLLPCFRKRKSH